MNLKDKGSLPLFMRLATFEKINEKQRKFICSKWYNTDSYPVGYFYKPLN